MQISKLFTNSLIPTPLMLFYNTKNVSPQFVIIYILSLACTWMKICVNSNDTLIETCVKYVTSRTCARWGSFMHIRYGFDLVFIVYVFMVHKWHKTKPKYNQMFMIIEIIQELLGWRTFIHRGYISDNLKQRPK